MEKVYVCRTCEMEKVYVCRTCNNHEEMKENSENYKRYANFKEAMEDVLQ